MYDLKPNLEPGNPDGHTVLRYLVESKQMPLEVAIERVSHAVAKYAQEYRSDQNKLLGGMIVTGVLGLPVFFPFGVSSLLMTGAIGASAFRWQELGTMRDRLIPEYQALKGSVLLEQFIGWLAHELKERREQPADSGVFKPDAITTANILAAYEHTVLAVTNGEHLENNASDPILALFVLKLRQHTNHLPDWVVQAFRQLEQAEVQRAADVEKASRYMWGNLEERYPEYFKQQSQPKAIGSNTRLEAVEVPAQPVQKEGEQSLGKPTPTPIEEKALPPSKVPPTPRDIALELAKIPKSTIIAASPRVGKGVVVAMAIAHLRRLYPDLEIWLIDPKDEPTERYYWGNIDLDKRCHFDLRPYDVDTEQAVQVFEEHLIRFNQSTRHRKLLIIDEFVTLNQKCAGQFMTRLKDFIVGICSSGEVAPDRGLGRFVWVITQSPYTRDLGFQTKAAIATFQRVFLLNTASIQLYPTAVTAGFIPDRPIEDAKEMLLVTGRAFYYSRTDSWHPVPSYELPHPDQGMSNQDKQAWDRLILEATDEQINELIDRMRGGNDTGNDTENDPKNSDTDPDISDTSDTRIDTGNSDTSDTADTTGVSGDTTDTKPIPSRLSSLELVSLIKQMKDSGLSQTQIIQALWGVQKNRTGWKQAYAEYKDLMGEG